MGVKGVLSAANMQVAKQPTQAQAGGAVVLEGGLVRNGNREGRGARAMSLEGGAG